MSIHKIRLAPFFLGTLLTLLLPIPVAHAMPVWSFSVLPTGGDIAGSAGSTIGWGYTIDNPDTVNSLSLTGLVADPFLNGTPDGSLFNYPVVAPNSTITVAYHASTGTGLYALTWDPSAPVGSVDRGTFTLSADWIDAGGNFLQGAPDQSATYSATVSAVPVPAAVWLFSSGLLGLLCGVRRKATRSV